VGYYTERKTLHILLPEIGQQIYFILAGQGHM